MANKIQQIYDNMYIYNLKLVLKYFYFDWIDIKDIKLNKNIFKCEKDEFLKDKFYYKKLGKDIITNGTYVPFVISDNNQNKGYKYTMNYGNHRLFSLIYENYTKKIPCIIISKEEEKLKNRLNEDICNNIYDNVSQEKQYDKFKLEKEEYVWVESDEFCKILNFRYNNKPICYYKCNDLTFKKIKVEYRVELIMAMNSLFDSIRPEIFKYHNTNKKLIPSKLLNKK